MLNTALTIMALAGGTAQRLPDQIDVIRGADRTPQIALVVDLSGSMLANSATPGDPCPYYLADTGRPGGYVMRRLDELIASLTGCQTSNDGILDRFSSQVVFSLTAYYGSVLWAGRNADTMVPFPGTTDPVAYESDLTALEAAAHSLDALADINFGTPLAYAYREVANSFADRFNDSNTEQCRPNGIVLMTDGLGNGRDDVSGLPVRREEHFNWLPDVASVSVSDALNCYGTGSCPPEYLPPHLDVAARYLYGTADTPHDALPSVGTGTLDEDQPLITYTVGFSAPTEAANLMRAMAANGGGEYFEASNTRGLVAAFERAILQISQNSSGSFSGPTVQGDGFFSGNYVYQPYFQGRSGRGAWYGNLKKFCVYPTNLLTDECLFDSAIVDGETTWVYNATPRDVWTTDSGSGTRSGGAGLMVLDQMSPGALAVGDASIQSDPYAGRNIVTWVPDGTDYVDVSDSSLDSAFTQTLTACEHYGLINHLYGYTVDADCSAPFTGRPEDYDRWLLSDSINGGQALLKYTEECEDSSADRCYLLRVSNSGMLHIFDAVTGNERQAIIPPHFFQRNDVANNQLAEIEEQPTLDQTRRFFFDGGMSFYHDDRNQDGIINSGERAYVIAGFGRGGAAYIRWDVSSIHSSGQFTASLNPPRPLVRDSETGYRHLQDTWAAPWTGDMLLPDGTTTAVAVFPSGHMPELDEATVPFAQPIPLTRVPSGDTETSPHAASCADLGIPAEVCDTPTTREICVRAGVVPSGLCGSGNGCSACDLVNVADCATNGFTPPFCYNWPGLAPYALITPGIPEWGITSIYPFQMNAGPYRYDMGGGQGVAYRVHFAEVDLQAQFLPGVEDYIGIYDEVGNEIDRITGDYRTNVTSAWVRSPAFSIRVVTDGINNTEGTGFVIDHIDVVRDTVDAPPGEFEHPSVFVTDLNVWNNEPGGFDDIPGPGDTHQADGLLVRFTSDCGGLAVGPDEVCVDAASAPDLQYMLCPISAEPRIYAEGGLLRAIYLGDECGQIWSFEQDLDGTGWSAQRLLTTNERGAGFTIQGDQSRNYRKIFAPVDLVVSTCPGERSVGVYFGTGNLQRPAIVPSTDPAAPPSRRSPDLNLDASPLVTSSDRDLMGVVWDNSSVPAGGYELDDLAEVTSVAPLNAMDGVEDGGYYLQLDSHEKVLRSPLVFDGTAYFQTYYPTAPATECDDASAYNRLYAFDNCTAEPRASTRLIRETESGLAAGFTTYADNVNGVMITGGGDSGDVANIIELHQPSSPPSGIRLLLWRVDI